MDMVFRDVSKIDDFTDASIYRFFNINESEQSTIKSFLKGKKDEPATAGAGVGTSIRARASAGAGAVLEGGARRLRFTRKIRRS